MPSLLEVAIVIGNISNILLEPLKDVPQLVKKFKMLPDTDLSFLKLYKEDPELIELQQKLNNGRIILLPIQLSVLFCLQFILPHYK